MSDFKTAAPSVLTSRDSAHLQHRGRIGLGLIAAVVLALATGQARGLSIVAYVIALVFFLQFFEIFPFSG